MKVKNYIFKGYRITPLQDKIIKRTAKKDKLSQSEVVRNLIDKINT